MSTPFAFSVAFRMMGDEDLAKDIIQETMVTVWQKIKKLESAEAYKAWMYRILINKCYDQLRWQKRKPEHIADDSVWKLLGNKISEGPSADLENTENAKIIAALTNSLSSKQKAVFIMAEIEDLSHDEISSITGISKSGVKANLYHARKRISELAEKYL